MLHQGALSEPNEPSITPFALSEIKQRCQLVFCYAVSKQESLLLLLLFFVIIIAPLMCMNDLAGHLF